MRCPDCNKFVSMDNGDLEINDVNAEYAGENNIHVTASVRAVRNCADCGTELKALDLELEEDVALDSFENYKLIHPDDLGIFLAGVEAGDVAIEAEEGDSSVEDGGGGRYKKNMIRTSLTAKLSITWAGGDGDDAELKREVELSSENAASEFEEQ